MSQPQHQTAPEQRPPEDHAAPGDADPQLADTADERLVESDLLVEDVSIDGMCGVY